jgi:hypothetical protein
MAVSTSQLNRSQAPGARAAPAPRSSLRVRFPAAVVGLLGAGVCAYGVTLPWLTTYNGLLAQSGWGSRNGTIAVLGSAVAAVLAASQALRPGVVTRWLLALAGFGLAAFAGYLLIQLYAVFSQFDGMTFAAKGPGLYVVAAGAATIFATIFLPMPQRAVNSPAVEQAPIAERAPSAPPRLSPMFRGLRSPLRYPAAALAVVAGLAHVPVTPEHLREAPYIGVLFLVLTSVCVLLAAALLISDSAPVWIALGTTTTLAVAAYVVSRTVGLPLMADDVGYWLEPLGVVSVVTESAVAGCAVLALRRARRSTHA